MFPGYGRGGGGGYGGYGGGSYESIPLQVRVPQMPNPMDYVGQMVNFQNAIQMRQLRDAEIRNQNLEAQQRQREFASQNAAADYMMRNPEGGSEAQPQPAQPESQTPNSQPASAPYTSMAPAMQTAPPVDSSATAEPRSADNLLTYGMGMPSAPATPAPVNPVAVTSDVQRRHTTMTQDGYPVVDYNGMYRGLVSSGVLPKDAASIITQRRADENARLLNYKERMEGAASNIKIVSQMAHPFAQLVSDGVTDPNILQPAYQQFRNGALSLPPGPNGQPLFTEKDLPETYGGASAKFGDTPLKFIPQWFARAPEAQKTLLEHAQYIKATAEGAKDHYTLANTWVANSQSQQDIDNARLLAVKRYGFTRDEADSLFPQQWSQQAKDQAKQSLINPYQQGNLDYKENRLDQQAQALDLRRQGLDITKQGLDIRQTLADSKLALDNLRLQNNGLTPGQQNVQTRFDQRRWDTVHNQEEGLHNRLIGLYSQLQSGTDAQGRTVDAGVTRGLIQGAIDQIQSKQYDKAQIMGIETPSSQNIASLKDNDPNSTLPTSKSGVVWQKRGGIVYPVGVQSTGTSNPSPSTPKPGAASPGANKPPAAQQPPPPRPQQNVDVPRLQSWANQNPGRRAYNRQTGAAVEWNGKQWTPVQVP